MPNSPRVAITHTIEQHFDRPVRLSTHWLRLRPAPQTRARVTAYSLAIDAQPHFLNWVRDPFENYLARLDLPEPVTKLGFTLELIAELEPFNPFAFLTEPYAAKHPFEYPEQLKKELAPYLHVGTQGPRWSAFTRQFEPATLATTERLDAVNRVVHRARGDGARSEPGLVDPEVALARGACSPWELAWLLTLSLRHVGLAARFVSGLRLTLADADGGDFAVRHAWSEVFLPGAGWIGLDPDAGLFCAETYIPFAAATDPLRAVPIAGFIEACQETQHESLRARRLVPVSPSGPVGDTAWHDIRALGDGIDADLAASGVKPALALSLSLVAHPALAPEWNTDALGPSKRWSAETLLQRLLPRMAAGGVMHESQGLWWSGEPLPRWRFSGFFRNDGAPLWRESSTHAGVEPRRFADALARALQLPPSAFAPAYEDGLAALCQARAGSIAFDPSELHDPVRRRALTDRLSAAAAGDPVGYVLPIRHDDTTDSWVTKPWAFRRDRLYLIPGSSALGYRLPLESLVDDAQQRIEAQLERDPFEPRGPLPAQLAPCTASGALAAGSAPRTALCVERRDGSLRVFLPPVSQLEHYLQLLAAVELAAAECQCAVRLEGYEPPEDPRLARIVLDPEPGALRLQLPETTRFRAHVAAIEAAYDEAAGIGLYAERPLFDPGSHMPSGPSRITISGASPEDSPFLTRPSILRQLIACFQRHPSLSYLFAGKWIGPSGVAPRPDEGRDEGLYELSLALERLPERSSEALWQADRVVRHLLVDPAGDPKRAELRVDQLYAPDRAGMRQGRVTVNAFETAADPRTAALQSLLVLALLGRFAKLQSPSELTRWGAELHDRFMLPSVLQDDLARVIELVQAAGYPFQLSWFDALIRTRFPVLGAVPIGTITLELRVAHEPWPLLAEEVTPAGVARFVDAANERLQVKLTGIAAERHVLKCNRERVPLQPMAANGEFVAGVRYKVANPPATLHPTLAPVTALVFDVIDTWSGRVIGGCTYYPAQRSSWWPGGSVAGALAQPYDLVGSKAAPERVPLPPITLLSPGGQSAGRFVPHGSGDPSIPPKRVHGERPHLLDLTQSL